MNDGLLRCWLVQAGFKVSDVLRDDIDRALSNSTTPLMYAARMGDIEAVNGLLAHGADPALINSDGNGALWLACFADSEECVTALIKAGAPLRHPEYQRRNGADLLRLGRQGAAGAIAAGCGRQSRSGDAG
jgi:ankyrin repeat protein